MKKVKSESAPIDAPATNPDQRPKSYEVVYTLQHKDQEWPILIKFADRVMKTPENHLTDGFFELTKVSGQNEAVNFFIDSVLSSQSARTRLETWLTEQIEKIKHARTIRPVETD